MGSSTPECVCVTPMCVEQGKYTAAGEEAEVHVFACAPGLDRRSPEPWAPGVYVGRNMPAAWCAWPWVDTSVQGGRARVMV